MKTKSRSKIFSWLTVPPVVAIFTFIGVRILCGSTTVLNSLDKAIWAMSIMLFIVLSALYCMFIIHDWHEGLLPIQLIAQGLLICPMALSFDAKIFPWVGVLLSVCGAVSLVVKYHRKQLQQELRLDWASETNENADSRLPILFIVTDENGIIMRISKSLLKLAHKSDEQVLGQNLGALIEITDDGTAKLGEKSWALMQIPMEGNCYYFQLTEKPKSVKNLDAIVDAGIAANAVDPETNLMTMNTALTRIGEEIYRTRRYGHQLTTALVRLVFPSSANKDGSADTSFKAWCVAVSKNLREPDIAATASSCDLVLALPECPKGSANTVIQKLLALIPALSEQYPALANITPLYVTSTFEGSDAIPDAKDLIVKMTQDLGRKYTLNNANTQDGK